MLLAVGGGYRLFPFAVSLVYQRGMGTTACVSLPLPLSLHGIHVHLMMCSRQHRQHTVGLTQNTGR